MEASNVLAIECRGLIKDYPGHRALDGVELKVERGSFHGFLGPNGAGKTTTMRILSGLLNFDEGELLLQGKTQEELGVRISELVGFMPEVPLLYDSLSVSDILTFAGELKVLPKTILRTRHAELIERCQLGPVSKRRVGNLSKGYRQRVGLAMALIHNPAIVILDEPTVGLDPVTLGPIRELLLGLKGEHTVLFSSHILSEVQNLCDTVTIINHGRVLKSGSVSSLGRELQASSVYSLEVQGDERAQAKLREVLSTLEGVKSVEIRSIGHLEIHCSRDIDPRAKISKHVIECELVLLGFSQSELSLEEIFKEVTTRPGGE